MVVEHAEKAHRLFSNYTIRIPQDPGQAGKSQADAVRRALAPYKRVRVVPISGPKAARARGWAEKVNVGNVKLLKAAWNDDFIREHSKFREDGNHLCDDQVDAASDAFNELATPGTGRVVAQGIRPNPLYKRDA
jgi:predicted phage terminase large subunit-like protein